MKKVYTGLFALVVTLLLSSCGDDESALPKRIVFDGEKASVTNGYVMALGIAEDDNGDRISQYLIILTSGDLVINEEGGLDGTGSFLFSIFNSPSSVQLANDTYTIDVGEATVKSTAAAFAQQNYNSDTGMSDANYQVVSGTIKLSRSGSKFKITFNLVMNNGEEDVPVTGSYEGNLEETALAL